MLFLQTDLPGGTRQDHKRSQLNVVLDCRHGKEKINLTNHHTHTRARTDTQIIPTQSEAQCGTVGQEMVAER